MIIKIYDKVKQYLKKNYIFIILLLFAIFISFYEFPCYINAPGGVIDVSSKIKIDNANKVEGSFNMAYVSEYKATLSMLILALFNNDWDIEKKSNVSNNYETDKEIYTRDHILLEEANQNAIFYAYHKAGKEVNFFDTKVYCTHIFEEARTNLKLGDQIISVNGIEIDGKEKLSEIIETADVGSILTIKVINNKKEYTRTAEVIEIEDEEQNKLKLIAIMVSELSDYEVDPNITLNFVASESGPSGGLLMSLSIYNYLVEEDITKGKRIAGTGTIDEDGNVGSIGGIEYKIKGAVKANIKYFLVPSGQNYEDAVKIKNEKNYDIEIYPVSTFDDALKYLEKL